MVAFFKMQYGKMYDYEETSDIVCDGMIHLYLRRGLEKVRNILLL